MLDVFRLVKKERRLDRPSDTEDWFIITPSKVWPAAIKHIKKVLKSGTFPSGALLSYYTQARELDQSAWKHALQAPDVCPVELRDQRAMALEFARLIFTEMLHNAVGEPIRIYIRRDSKYRLYTEAKVIKEKDRTLLKWLGFSIVKE